MKRDINPQATVNLHHSDLPGSRNTPFAGLRRYTAVRTALISYGVAAFGYLFSRTLPADTTPVFGGIPTWGLVLLGVILQVLMFAGRALIKRHAPDPASAARGLAVLELVGDGATVLLFALGTYGAILQIAENI